MEFKSPNGKTVLFHFIDKSLIGTEDRLPAEALAEIYEAVDQEPSDTVHIIVEGNWESYGIVRPDQIEALLAELPAIQEEDAKHRALMGGLVAALRKDCPHCAVNECLRRTAAFVGPYPTQPPF